MLEEETAEKLISFGNWPIRTNIEIKKRHLHLWSETNDMRHLPNIIRSHFLNLLSSIFIAKNSGVQNKEKLLKDLKINLP